MTIFSRFKSFWHKPAVRVQKGFSFVKYPAAITINGRTENLSNMIYGVATVENHDRQEHVVSLLVRLKGSKQYQSQVVSQNSTEAPNPSIMLVGAGETEYFHPIALRLSDLKSFIPSNSSTMPGAIWGRIVDAGVYDVYCRLIVDGQLLSEKYNCTINTPSTLLDQAVLPADLKALAKQAALTFNIAGEIRHEN